MEYTKGATAELPPKKINKATSTIDIITGTNHHCLRSQRN